jgi:hypothetical protein
MPEMEDPNRGGTAFERDVFRNLDLIRSDMSNLSRKFDNVILTDFSEIKVKIAKLEAAYEPDDPFVRQSEYKLVRNAVWAMVLAILLTGVALYFQGVHIGVPK